MADVNLGGIDFVLTGTVNNLAAPMLSFDGGDGSFVQNSNLLYTWDFGTVSELADILFTGNFRLTNAATGPADNLDGTWDTTGANAFQVGGFDAVDDLAAGRSIAGLQVRFDSALFGPGAFGGSVFLDPRSVFLGLDDVDLAPIELRFVGRIRADGGVGVPAPGALALLVLAAMGLGLRRSRRAAA